MQPTNTESIYSIRHVSLRRGVQTCPISGRRFDVPSADNHPAEWGIFLRLEAGAWSMIHPGIVAEEAPELSKVLALVPNRCEPGEQNASIVFSPAEWQTMTCAVRKGEIFTPRRPFEIASAFTGRPMSQRGSEREAPNLAASLHAFYGTAPDPTPAPETSDERARRELREQQALSRRRGETDLEERNRLAASQAERRAEAVAILAGILGADKAHAAARAVELLTR